MTTLSIKKFLSLSLILCLSFGQTLPVLAQESGGQETGGTTEGGASAETGAPTNTGATDTGAPKDTGAPDCTGAGCSQGAHQGTNQGSDQGTNQGGVSANDLGADEEGNLPEGVVDTRQGASQGQAQGQTNGITVDNSGTGAGSNNTGSADTNSSTSTAVSNTAHDATTAGLAANSGGNASNANTGLGGLSTGNAGIGVTQVKNDNSTVIGGGAGLQVSGHNGDYIGDLNLGFGASTAALGNGANGSLQAVNQTTGSDSNNQAAINTLTQALTEVQNDGLINNLLNLAAITGQNQTNKNTGDGSITTGNADIAATLVNLLNTTVINGNLWLSVQDIFGDLVGNITLPDLAQLASLFAPAGVPVAIEAGNNATGSDSNNEIAIAVTDTDKTKIANDAQVDTTVNAQAVTGQNETTANTGGGQVQTGDAAVNASNITLANSTVEGGNWGLVIVNALNRWLGFMVSETGQVQALSPEETIRHLEANNNQTGSDSNNEVAIDVANEQTTNVNNQAQINNEINAAAITGQNEANKNTGGGNITTGDARVHATAINIANTTVKDGSLLVAVVNIFGDWFGDLLYRGNSLLAAAGKTGPDVAIEANNTDTGADSTNTINVDVDRTQETTIDNKAKVKTILNANIDTGSNRANRNTQGGSIATGNGELALHARTFANLTGIMLDPGLSVAFSSSNDTTGVESKNIVRARINDERLLTINNYADIMTWLPALINTGNNESSRNTIGGLITTGDAAAHVGLENVVNQVLLALAYQDGLSPEQLQLQADMLNHLTGALSENSNDLSVVRNVLAQVFNDAFVNNLIDILLNTGGNVANENTSGGLVFSGASCFSGDLDNDVNYVQAGSGTSLLAGQYGYNQYGEVTNQAQIGADTGNNQTNDNTSAGDNSLLRASSSPCHPAIAQAPEATPAPTIGGGAVGGGEIGEDERGQHEGDGDQGQEEEPDISEEGEGEEGENEEAKVAGGGPEFFMEQVMPRVLRRFPVAGGGRDAGASGGETTRNRSQLAMLGGFSALGLLALAFDLDRRAKLAGKIVGYKVTGK